MIPAWDYKQVCRELGNAFRYRYKDRHAASVRMVGLLFAPPEVRLARDEIVPGLDYFHHRSGDNIDFFCGGYRRYGYEVRRGEREVTKDEPPWIFSTSSFEAFREEIQRLTRWRYSGEADLLLMNGISGGEADTAHLDFSSAITCDLDRMIRDKAISSVRRFFEEVFQFAEKASGTDPTWGFSDHQGLRAGGSALKRAILALLPRKLGDEYARAEHLAVRDLSATSSR
jgi:hypothetical protein